MSTPQSTIYICSGVRLDNRYEHSIYFANANAQREYFAGKVVHTFSAYSYLRKSWPLQVQATMEQAKSWSYLYFRNGSGKYYYYFINQVEYKNDNMVELSLELDVLQTYLEEIKAGLLPSFIERQHTETDKLGEYTMDEGLDVGELVESGPENWSSLSDMCVLVLSTINPNYATGEKPVSAMGSICDNVFSGLSVWAVKRDDWGALSQQLDALSTAGFVDGILAMWMYPKECIVLGGENTWNDDLLFKVVKGCSQSYQPFTYTQGSYTSVSGHTVKNKKALCYPYRFLYATNNQGESASYRFERFLNPLLPTFLVKGAISADASVRMYPDDYNGISHIWSEGIESSNTDCDGNYEYGLSLSNYPSCAWDADVYKMWLAQNQNQHTMAMAGGIIGVGAGALAGVASIAMMNPTGALGGVGAMYAGAQQIGNLLAQKRDMAVQPPQSRGSFSSSVNVVAKMHTFTFCTKSADKEHIKAIDDYFTMYGYKLHRVQQPNICARPSFTYIKTVGCNIQANMCTEDRLKITGIFDKGVTFWRNGDRIGEYTQPNLPEEV